MRVPHWKSLVLCLRVTNQGGSGFGKASEGAKAKEHRPYGIPVDVWWGALSAGGEKLDVCSTVIIRFTVSIPSGLVKP